MRFKETPFDIPEFPDDPADELLEESMQTPVIVSPEVAESIFLAAQVPKPKTYKDYLSQGTAAYEQAVSNEAFFGLHSAVHKYEEARVQFLGAIGSRPLTVDGRGLEEPDPMHVVLPLARCMTKQLQANTVQPYIQRQSTDPEARGYDRSNDWRAIATNDYVNAWEAIRANPDISDEDRWTASIAVVGGLHILHDVSHAESVLDEASESLAYPHEIDPKLAKFLGKPVHEQLHIATELEEQASIDVVTGSHEALAYLTA